MHLLTFEGLGYRRKRCSIPNDYTSIYDGDASRLGNQLWPQQNQIPGETTDMAYLPPGTAQNIMRDGRFQNLAGQ